MDGNLPQKWRKLLKMRENWVWKLKKWLKIRENGENWPWKWRKQFKMKKISENGQKIGVKMKEIVKNREMDENYQN